MARLLNLYNSALIKQGKKRTDEEQLYKVQLRPMLLCTRASPLCDAGSFENHTTYTPS